MYVYIGTKKWNALANHPRAVTDTSRPIMTIRKYIYTLRIYMYIYLYIYLYIWKKINKRVV